MRVRDPQGRKWRVRRRWAPWRRRLRDTDMADWLTSPSLPSVDDPISLIFAVLLLLLLIPVIVLAALVLLELLLLLLALPVVLLLRLALRKPWIIDISGPKVPGAKRAHHTDAVRGFAASGARVKAIAEAIRAGAWAPPVS